MSDKQLHIIIEKLLLGKLNNDELIELQKEMDRNPAIEKDIYLHKLAQNAITQAGYIDVKNKLQNIHSNSINKNRLQKRIIQASIVLAIVTATIIFFIKKTDRNDHNNNLPILNIDTVSAHKDTTIYSENIIDAEPPKIQSGSDQIIQETKRDSIVLTKTKKELPSGIQNTTNTNNTNQLVNKEPKTIINKEKSWKMEKVEPKTEEKENEQKKTEYTKSITKCDTVTIEFDLEHESSCNNIATGIIRINNVTGGKTPYDYLIENSYNQSLKDFIGLKSGWYTIIVRDQNGCETRQTTYVDEEDCSYKYKFAPSMGDVWEIPNTKNLYGNITIFDKLGKIVFRKELSGSDDYWDGKSLNGTNLPIGSYKYIIQYEDKTTNQGNVTVIK